MDQIGIFYAGFASCLLVLGISCWLRGAKDAYPLIALLLVVTNLVMATIYLLDQDILFFGAYLINAVLLAITFHPELKNL